jgi:hypothetical protein
MASWKGQLGRITLFPAIPTGADVGSALDLYKRTWNSDPDSFQKQPQIGLPFVASIAQGTVSGLSIACSVNPIRIDLSITPPSSSDFVLIEDTKLFHNVLSQVVQSVTENNTIRVNRAACFVQFACPAKNYQEANELIRTILPKQFTLQLADEEDFILQVNRPRQIDDVKMNYITKWAVDRLQILALQVLAPQAQQTPTMSKLLSEHIVGSVTFDNSNAATAPLSKERLATILGEAFRVVSEQQYEAHLGLEGF